MWGRRDDFVEYRLPETMLVVRGTKVERIDKALVGSKNGGRTVRTQAQVVLETEADGNVHVARVAHSWFVDTSVGLELTEDRRLTSASSESAGQAGKVVLGVVSAAAGVAGVAAGLWPMAAGAAGVAAIAATRDASLMAEAGRSATEALDREADETDEQLVADLRKDADAVSTDARLVADVYLIARRTEALQRQRFANRAKALLVDLANALWDADMAGDDATLQAATARAKRCRAALEIARAELARLDAVFEAWRATQVDEKKTQVDLRMPLHKVLEAVTKSPPPTGTEYAEVLKTLRSLGLWLKVTHADARFGDDSPSSWKAVIGRCMQSGSGAGEPARWADGVVVRQPRRLTLNLYQRYEGDDPTSWETADAPPPDVTKEEWRLVESRRCSVAGDDCHHEFVPFRRSWWGKKTVGLDLWPSGGVKKYSFGSTSQAAAVAGMAADLPSTFGGGLKDSASILEQLDALQARRDPDAALLASVKSEVESKTWKLALAGLNATTGQVQELERLKQQLAVLQAKADLDALLGGGA